LWDGLSAFLGRVRSHTDLPLVVGFGISTPEHVRTVSKAADGAIVASALINLMDQVDASKRVATVVEYLKTLRPNI
jgi:tryptophan synthase alpha chain